MTYFITAHTNDEARLIVSESRTTDAAIAELIASELRKRGYHTETRHEG